MKKVLECHAPDTAGESDDPSAVAFLDEAVVCQLPEISTFDEARVYYRDTVSQRVLGPAMAQQVMAIGSPYDAIPGAVMTFEVRPTDAPKFYLNYGLFDAETESSLTVSGEVYVHRRLACEHFFDSDPVIEP